MSINNKENKVSVAISCTSSIYFFIFIGFVFFFYSSPIIHCFCTWKLSLFFHSVFLFHLINFFFLGFLFFCPFFCCSFCYYLVFSYFIVIVAVSTIVAFVNTVFKNKPWQTLKVWQKRKIFQTKYPTIEAMFIESLYSFKSILKHLITIFFYT